ncbi:ATP-binding protein [Pseudomonas solani]|uniref:ATP-binding protein n=1 Tax=Pseudomonas solani TaxID=2731552 RepID=UPI0003F726B3
MDASSNDHAFPAPPPTAAAAGDFLNSVGEMAPLIRAHDWGVTPLGALQDWAAPLKSILGVGLNSRFPVCIYWGRDYHLLYNDAYSAIPGDKHPWALGRPAREAWADIWDTLEPMFDGIMQTGVAVHVEDGLLPMQRFGYVEECYFNYNVSPILGFDGRPTGLFNTVIETTVQVIEARRSRLLGELRASTRPAANPAEACRLAEEVLRSAAADLPFCLLYRLNAEGRAELALCSGLEPGDALAPLELAPGTAPWAATAAGDTLDIELERPRSLPPWPEPVTRARVLPLIADAADDRPLGVLVCAISPRRPLDARYRRFLDELAESLSGDLARAARQAEETDRLHQRTLERDRLWNLSLDLLCVADQQGRLLSINPAWTTTLGWSEEELLGRTTHWLEHPDDIPSTDQTRQELAGGLRIRRFENRLRHRDGSYRWLSWSATPENDIQYGSGHDVTEEKRTAEVLQRTEEALRNAQRMEAVGQLTGGIAHDFNNLLAGIRVGLDLIRRRLPDESRQDLERFIDAATDSAERGATLTHNLLSFARRQALDIQPIRLDAWLAEHRPHLAERAGPAVKLVLQVDPLPTTALCDAEQLCKALEHLVDNAREAMPDGGQLLIRASIPEESAEGAEPNPGDYLLLEVHDTGRAMDERVLSHAFEPFFTTKPLGQGSGLGLSMVYGFIKQTGGQVRLQSGAGQGTRVSLYLPRGPVLSEQQQSPVEQPTGAANRESILVVEDADVVRMLTVEVLEEFGYQVMEACDGQQALAILRSDATIDLLLTDIGLPGMNGQELAAVARDLRPGLRVLFATGYAEIVSIDGSELATQMDMIAKPFSIDELREKVSSLLEGRGKAR